MNKPKAVIFDIDGTLSPVNSWTAFTQDIGASAEDHIAIYNQLLAGTIDIDESREQLLAMWKATGKANKAHIEKVFDSWPLKGDAQDLINWLKSAGYIICLITGSVGVYAEHIANRLSVEHYYANAELHFDDEGNLHDFHYTANQAEVKLEQLTEFCEAQNIDPEECVAVGDGPNDIELFRNTKHGVLIESEKVPNDLREASWKTIRELSELRNFLSN